MTQGPRPRVLKNMPFLIPFFALADMAGVGPLGMAGPLRSFFTVSRMMSTKSLVRLLTTGGVDGNVCRGVAISAGGFSTNLNRKKFERTYLETNHQVFPWLLELRHSETVTQGSSLNKSLQCGQLTSTK